MIAISTAYKEALIAIEIEGKTSFKSLDSNCKHSENMLYNIDEMLDEMGQSIKNNDYYSVVVGPGSFTGIRIGISLIKGLCAGKNDKIIVPLTTFDLMAYSYIKNFAPTSDFTCILNGLSGYYFICQYSKDGIKQSDEKMITKADLETIKTRFVGLQEENIVEEMVSPTPVELLELSQNKSKESLYSAKEILPLYLRKSQAECGLEEKIIDFKKK